MSIGQLLPRTAGSDLSIISREHPADTVRMFGGYDHAVGIDDIDVEDIRIVKVMDHGLLYAEEIVDHGCCAHDREGSREGRRSRLRILLNEEALPDDEEAGHGHCNDQHKTGEAEQEPELQVMLPSVAQSVGYCREANSRMTSDADSPCVMRGGVVIRVGWDPPCSFNMLSAQRCRTLRRWWGAAGKSRRFLTVCGPS